MKTTIQKWGNSLAVRLPKDVASGLTFREGSSVEVRSEKGGILISAVSHAHRSLKELVSAIRPAQLHGETVWGDAH